MKMDALLLPSKEYKMANRKVGRPKIEYKSEYSHMLIAHMSKGLSFETFAAEVPPCLDTLYTWTHEIEEFSEAFKVAKAKCQLYWENTGIRGINGKIRGFSANGWAFWMKNRFKWHDNLEIKKPDTEKAKDDEIEKLANELLKLKGLHADDPVK